MHLFSSKSNLRLALAVVYDTYVISNKWLVLSCFRLGFQHSCRVVMFRPSLGRVNGRQKQKTAGSQTVSSLSVRYSI